jgi:septal ring factor EnvC (AmiA/AmiB activator)
MSRANAYRTRGYNVRAGYKIDEDGQIVEAPWSNFYILRRDGAAQQAEKASKDYSEYPYTSLIQAQNAQAKQQQEKIKNAEEETRKLKDKYESELSKERQYSALADQIAGLTGGVRRGG